MGFLAGVVGWIAPSVVWGHIYSLLFSASLLYHSASLYSLFTLSLFPPSCLITLSVISYYALSLISSYIGSYGFISSMLALYRGLFSLFPLSLQKKISSADSRGLFSIHFINFGVLIKYGFNL